jgi:hypothetical protein
MAIDAFPCLLLPDDPGSPHGGILLFRHPAEEELLTAIHSDPALSMLWTEDDPGLGRRGHIATSLGHGGSHQSCMFGERIIASAWSTLEMTQEHPELADLVHQVHLNLDVLRAAATGDSVDIPARVVFTGFTVDGRIIESPWGILRPLTSWERDRAPLSLTGGVSAAHPDGTPVYVSAAGELVLEALVPYSIAIQEGFDWTKLAAWPMKTDALWRKVEGVQLAALLTSEPGSATGSWITAKWAWSWVGDPYGSGSSMQWDASDPRYMPVALTSGQCDSLAEWARLIDIGWTPRIDIAVRRILSAAHSRFDMADRLVDSVIVWENLFGTQQGETTLRISAAMAWLLASDATSRAKLQTAFRDLYVVRSKIVHGASDSSEVGTAANQALEHAIDALRRLLRDRPDILGLPNGAARSLRLILDLDSAG